MEKEKKYRERKEKAVKDGNSVRGKYCKARMQPLQCGK